MKESSQYSWLKAYSDYVIKKEFKREVSCFAAEGMGIIAMSSQDRVALVEFDFFQIWEAMKAAPRMPKNAWMIHTHPPGYAEKSEEDTSSIKGWVTGLGMPIEMVICSNYGDMHYRCNTDRTIIRRGFRNDSDWEKILTIEMCGMSKADKNPTEEEFANMVIEANNFFPISMWEKFTDPTDVGELWGADENCAHVIENSPGGGVRCANCNGWCCY
jgi:hypothetical protein